MVQVYVRLSERLGLSDHLLVLNVMLRKIATNMKVYGSCDEVITLTLALFQVTLLYLCPYPLRQLRQSQAVQCHMVLSNIFNRVRSRVRRFCLAVHQNFCDGSVDAAKEMHEAEQKVGLVCRIWRQGI